MDRRILRGFGRSRPASPGERDLIVPAVATLFAVLLSLVVVASANAQLVLLHQERSLYRNIFVTQNGDLRCMQFRLARGYGRQSCMLMHQPKKLIESYAQLMLAGLYFNTNPRRILIIGEGGGTIPTALQEMFADAWIDVVEIDDAVDKVARSYFDFRPGLRMRVIISDGRVFVRRAAVQKPRFDLVFLDAFDGEYIPEHMTTREFLQEVRAVMTPDGVLVANTFSQSALYDYESVTYRDVFGDFCNLKPTSKLSNRIILARAGGISQVDLVDAYGNAMMLEPEFVMRGVRPEFLLSLLSTTVDWNPKTRLLTDQYSPANLLNVIP